MKQLFIILILSMTSNVFGQTRKFAMDPDYKKEISELTELIKKNPDSVSYYLKRAKLVYELNHSAPKQTSSELKMKDVIPDLDKAIAIQPNNASLYEKRGEYKWQINQDTTGALADKSKAIELEPMNPKWLDERATMYVRIGDYDSACADCTKCAEMGDEKCKLGQRAFCPDGKKGF